MEKHGVSPPIDLENIASHYADIEYDALPCNSDALLLYSTSAGVKPRIILDKHKAIARRRFTLAHELGHIVIPWHIGKLSYHVGDDVESLLLQMEYDAVEREADKFAAELLAPKIWVDALFVDNGNDPKKVVGILMDSGLSKEASLYGAIKSSPPGNILVKCEIDNRHVVYACKSERTYVSVPEADRPFRPKVVFEGLKYGKKRFSVSGHNFYWMSFELKELPDNLPGMTSREILLEIMDDEGLEEDQIKKQWSSIFGIVAFVNGQMINADEAELFNGLLRRFRADSKFKCLIKHPLFEDFLVMRISELRCK